MKILALDLGTDTGWSIANDNKLIGFGTQNFDLKRGESNGMRFLIFRQWLERLWDDVEGFGLVMYELPHMRGGPATDLLIGLQTVVQEFCALHSTQYQSLHTSTLKKLATGHGHASKDDMIASAKASWNDDLTRLKRRVENDNEGDSLCLLATWGTK